jgi:hypothetical protein
MAQIIDKELRLLCHPRELAFRNHCLLSGCFLRTGKPTLPQAQYGIPDWHKGGEVHAKLSVQAVELISHSVLKWNFDGLSGFIQPVPRGSIAIAASHELASLFRVRAVWKPRLLNHQAHVFLVSVLWASDTSLQTQGHIRLGEQTLEHMDLGWVVALTASEHLPWRLSECSLLHLFHFRRRL